MANLNTRSNLQYNSIEGWLPLLYPMTLTPYPIPRGMIFFQMAAKDGVKITYDYRPVSFYLVNLAVLILCHENW